MDIFYDIVSFMIEKGPKYSDLTHEQRLKLIEFYCCFESIDAENVALVDQISTELKERFEDIFGLNLTSEKEYYDVMAAFAIALSWMENLRENEFDPKFASQLILRSLASLRPKND